MIAADQAVVIWAARVLGVAVSTVGTVNFVHDEGVCNCSDPHDMGSFDEGSTHQAVVKLISGQRRYIDVTDLQQVVVQCLAIWDNNE